MMPSGPWATGKFPKLIMGALSIESGEIVHVHRLAGLEHPADELTVCTFRLG